MSDQHNATLAEFSAITQLDPGEAREFLEQADWDISTALELFYAADEGSSIADDSSVGSGRGPQRSRLASAVAGTGSASSSRSSSQAATGTKKRFATFSDLKNEQADSPLNSGPDDPENLFTGGEKSGLAVQNPDEAKGSGSGSSSGRLINDIFRQARRRHFDNDDDDLYENTSANPRPANHFGGTGYTLGSDDVPSRAISTEPLDGATTAGAAAGSSGGDGPRKETTRKLYFWRNGFSVDEDGPLYRYDDPANVAYLQAIKAGRAPLSLLNVQGGEDVRVDVYRKDEDYVPPKKKPAAGFSGKGMRLGSPIPGETSASSSARSTAEPQAAPAATTSADSSLGSSGNAAVQLRLANGRAVRLRFDSDSPVQQLYDYVDQQHPSSRAYVLQTTFPNRELSDKSTSLKEAGVVGAVVVQKWAS